MSEKVSVITDVHSENIYGFVVYNNDSVKAIASHEDSKAWAAWVNDSVASFDESKELLSGDLQHELSVAADTEFLNNIYEKVDNKVFFNVRASLKNLEKPNIFYLPISAFSEDQKQLAVEYKTQFYLSRKNVVSLNIQGKAARAIYDRNIGMGGGWRCPDGTLYGGQITDRFGRGCGGSLTRRIGRAIAGAGTSLEETAKRRDDGRMARRADRQTARSQRRAERRERQALRQDQSSETAAVPVVADEILMADFPREQTVGDRRRKRRAVVEDQLSFFDDEVVPVEETSESEVLVKPTEPRKPSDPVPPPLSGRAQEIADEVGGDWEKFKEKINEEGFVVFDYETTGIIDAGNKPTQIGAVRIKDGEIVERFNIFVNPGEPLGKWSRDNLKDADGNPLTDEYLANQMSLEEGHKLLAEFLKDSIIAAHNLPFDEKILRQQFDEAGIEFTSKGSIDTLQLMRDVVPSAKGGGEGTPSHGLKPLAKFLGLEFEGWHRADVDAEVANEILQRGIDYAVKNNVGPKAFDVAYQNERFNKEKERYQAQLPAYEEAYEKFKYDLAAYENARQQGADLPPIAPIGSDLPEDLKRTLFGGRRTTPAATTDTPSSPKQRRQSRRERKAGKRKPKTEPQEIAPTQETPDSGSDSDADFVEIDASGDVRKQLVDAINSGKRVRFHYRGKNRDLEPKEIWVNNKNGNVNLKAADSEGYEKDYTISKISNSLSESELKRRELEKVFEDLGYVYVDFEATGRQVLIDPETDEIVAAAEAVDSVVDFVDEIEDTLDDAIISLDLDEEEFGGQDLPEILDEIFPDYIDRLNELDEAFLRLLEEEEEEEEDIPSPPDPSPSPPDQSVDPEETRREARRGRRLARRLQRDLKNQQKDLKKQEKKLNRAEIRKIFSNLFQDILKMYLEDRAFKKLPPQVQQDMIREARKAASSAARAQNQALARQKKPSGGQQKPWNDPDPRPRPRIPVSPGDRFPGGGIIDPDYRPPSVPRPRIPVDPDGEQVPAPRPRPRIPIEPLPDPDGDETPAPRPRIPLDTEKPDRIPKYDPLNETNEEKKEREELEKLEKDEAEKNDFNKPPAETEKSVANKLNLGLEALRDLRKASDLELGRVREKLKKDINSLLAKMNRAGQTPEQIKEDEKKLNNLLFNLEDVRHEIVRRTLAGVWLKKKDKDTTPKPEQKAVKEPKEAFEDRIVKDAERDVYPLDALANNELEKDLNRLQTDRDRIEKEAFTVTPEERENNPEYARSGDDLRKEFLELYDKRINEVKSEMRKREKDEPGSFPNINLDDPDPVKPPERKPRKKAAPKKKTPEKEKPSDSEERQNDVDPESDQDAVPSEQEITPDTTDKPKVTKKTAPKKEKPEEQEEEEQERMDYPPKGLPEKLDNSQETRYARFYNENDELNERGRYVNATVEGAKQASRRRYTVAERENIAAEAERQYENLNPSEPRLAPKSRRNVDVPSSEKEKEEKRNTRREERRRREQEAEQRAAEETTEETTEKKPEPEEKPKPEKQPVSEEQKEKQRIAKEKRAERKAEEEKRKRQREQLEALKEDEAEERRKRRAEIKKELEEKPQSEPEPEVREFDEKAEQEKYDLIDEGQGSFQATGSENSYLIQFGQDDWRPYVDGELLGSFKTEKEARKKYDERVSELVEQKRKEFGENVDKPDSDVQKPVRTKKAPPKKDAPRKARAKKAAPKKETEEKKTSDAEPYRSPLTTSSAMASNEEVKKAIADFDALPDDQLVVVYHGTTSENAEKIRESGVSGFDPRGDDVSAVSQGRGMYVAATPEDAEMYVGRTGGEVIAVTVTKGSLTVSPEMTTDSATVGYALYNPSSGAVIPEGIPVTEYVDFEKVDIPEKLVDEPSTPSQQAINRFPLRGLPNQLREPTPNDAWRQRFYDTEGNLNERGKFVNDFIRSEREKTSRKLSQTEIDSFAEEAEDNFDAINRGIADIPVKRAVESKPLASQAPPRVVGEPLIGGQQPLRRSVRKAVASKVGGISKRIQERRKKHPRARRAGFASMNRRLPNGLSYQQSSKGSYADRIDQTGRRRQRVRDIFSLFQQDFIPEHNIEIDKNLLNAALDGDIDEETLVAALDSAAAMIELTGTAPDVLGWDATDRLENTLAYVTNQAYTDNSRKLYLTLTSHGFSNSMTGERLEGGITNIDQASEIMGSWLVHTDLDPWQSVMVHEWGHIVQARLIKEDPEAFLDIASQIIELMASYGLVNETKISAEYKRLAQQVGKSPISRDFWMNEGKERFLANVAVAKSMPDGGDPWIDNPFGTPKDIIPSLKVDNTSVLNNTNIVSQYAASNSDELFAELFAMSFSGPSVVPIEGKATLEIREALATLFRDLYQQKRKEIDRKKKRKNAAKKRAPMKKVTAKKRVPIKKVTAKKLAASFPDDERKDREPKFKNLDESILEEEDFEGTVRFILNEKSTASVKDKAKEVNSFVQRHLDEVAFAFRVLSEDQNLSYREQDRISDFVNKTYDDLDKIFGGNWPAQRSVSMFFNFTTPSKEIISRDLGIFHPNLDAYREEFFNRYLSLRNEVESSLTSPLSKLYEDIYGDGFGRIRSFSATLTDFQKKSEDLQSKLSRERFNPQEYFEIFKDDKEMISFHSADMFIDFYALSSFPFESLFAERNTRPTSSVIEDIVRQNTPYRSSLELIVVDNVVQRIKDLSNTANNIVSSQISGGDGTQVGKGLSSADFLFSEDNVKDLAFDLSRFPTPKKIDAFYESLRENYQELMNSSSSDMSIINQIFGNIFDQDFRKNISLFEDFGKTFLSLDSIIQSPYKSLNLSDLGNQDLIDQYMLVNSFLNNPEKAFKNLAEQFGHEDLLDNDATRSHFQNIIERFMGVRKRQIHFQTHKKRLEDEMALRGIESSRFLTPEDVVKNSISQQQKQLIVNGGETDSLYARTAKRWDSLLKKRRNDKRNRLADSLRRKWGDESPWADPERNISTEQQKELLDDINDRYDTQEAKDTLESLMDDMYSIEYVLPDGRIMSSEVTKIDFEVNRIYVKGSVYVRPAGSEPDSSDKIEVGDFERDLLPSPYGAGEKPKIFHKALYLYTGEVKNSGFATVFNQHSLTWARHAGYETAEVLTGRDGPYVWAKAGFRSNDDDLENPDALVNVFSQQLKDYRAGLKSVIENDTQAEYIEMLLDQAQYEMRDKNSQPSHGDYILALTEGLPTSEDRSKELYNLFTDYDNGLRLSRGLLDLNDELLVPSNPRNFLDEEGNLPQTKKANPVNLSHRSGTVPREKLERRGSIATNATEVGDIPTPLDIVNPEIATLENAVDWVSQGGSLSQVPQRFWFEALKQNSLEGGRFRHVIPTQGFQSESHIFYENNVPEGETQGWFFKGMTVSDSIAHDVFGSNFAVAHGLTTEGSGWGHYDSQNRRVFSIIPLTENGLPSGVDEGGQQGIFEYNYSPELFDYVPDKGFVSRFHSFLHSFTLDDGDKHRNNGVTHLVDGKPFVIPIDYGYMERAYGPAHKVRKDKNEIKPLNDFLNNSEEDPLSFYGNKIYSMDFDLIEKIRSHYAGRPNVEEKEAFKQSIVEMYDGFIARARMISEIKFDQLMDKMMNGAPDGVDFSGAKKILERVFELHNINVKYLIDNRDAYIDFLFPK